MTETATRDAVTTSGGRVIGLARSGHSAFFGIPYAKAKRFGAPELADPWRGVKEATTIGLAAPQPSHPVAGFAASGPQGENCLNLNVFTPACDDAKRPVLVWIHGGGFTHGAGYELLYNGGPLATRGDVVVVTINYRLGALGFLRLPEIGAAGNQGLLDQIAALQWVRENIASFGGDPARVTIFGQSAGAASVGCLVTMPPAQGLFGRAIQQSGAGRAASPEAAERIAHAMLELLGLSRGEESDLLSIAPEEILKAQGMIGARLGADARFNPVVDPSVLPAAPISAVAAGIAKDIEVVIGTNRDEIKQFVAMTRREPIADAALAKDIGASLPKATAGDITDLIAVYRASRTQQGLPADNLDILDAVVTDVRFRIPSIQFADGQRASGGKAWMYLLTHESPARRGALGACHSVEMPFVFGTLDAPTQDRFVGTGADVERLLREMMDTWIGFARDGTPDHADIAHWPQYDAHQRPTMIFGTKASALQNDPFADERRAIEKLL